MPFAIVSLFLLACAVPWINRYTTKTTGWLVAILPLGLALYFMSHLPTIAAGTAFKSTAAWVPALGLETSFSLDGLSLLYVLLICGVGTLVLVYAGGYLAKHPNQGRFYALILAFMASMLGLVLSDNLIVLFIFWELTGIWSYFLIGFEHDRESARFASLQALLVTGAGGLSLLAGLLLLGQISGSFSLSELIVQSATIRNHDLYLPSLILILLGIFTKSAQIPFHFWLPNAMEAPTPASAYLHAATMVKAGVYLLARMLPVLGGTDVWFYIVTSVGALSMLFGAFMALQQTYLKRLLAYTTISALGMLIMLLGLGTKTAVDAAMVFLLAHACYKGAMFLVVGIIDHETGERNVEKLSGLRQYMPITAAASVLGALSMAGFPPLFGFISKELIFEATWHAPRAAGWLTDLTILASIGVVAVACIVGLRPFFGDKIETPKSPHEGPISLWLGPVILSSTGLLIGFFPWIADSLIASASAATLGKPTEVHLGLWHGFNLPLAFEGIAITGGILVFFFWSNLRQFFARFNKLAHLGPTNGYTKALSGLNILARLQTRLIQNGYLRIYLSIVILTTIGLVGFTLLGNNVILFPLSDTDFLPHEIGIAAIILISAVVVVRSKTRLGAITAAGVIGYSVALIFVLYGAPDLAMTQFVIETLTVILFVLVFYHLPPLVSHSSKLAKGRDLIIALTGGAIMTTLVLLAIHVQSHPTISQFFIENSLLKAHGRNIVNVILVDFRGFDTFGEITVLALAGVGVYALLKLRLEDKK